MKKINEKMKIIFLLFQGDFSLNERNIEEKIEKSIKPLNGQLISVCLDRKLFIQKVLIENISLSFIQKYIRIEEIEK